MGVRGDLQMVGRAIRGRWLTDDLKQLAMDAIRDGLQSDDDRAKQAAIKNLLMMEAQNQKDEQHDDHIRMDEGRNRILVLLGEGTAGPGLIEAVGEGTGVAGTGNPEESPQPATRTDNGRKPA